MEFDNRYRSRYLNLRGGRSKKERIREKSDYWNLRGGGIEEEHEKAYQTAMSLICPITQELILDPVTISTGRTFERSAIETYFRFSGTRDPTTNEPLSNRHITPSILVQTLTKQFVDFYEGKQGKEWERVVEYCKIYRATQSEREEREREQREREQREQREFLRRAEALGRTITITVPLDPSLFSSLRGDEEESLRRARVVQEARERIEARERRRPPYTPDPAFWELVREIESEPGSNLRR